MAEQYQEQAHKDLQAALNKSPDDTGIQTGGLPGYDVNGYPTTVDYSKVDHGINRGPDVDRSKGLALVSADADRQYNADQAYLDKAWKDGTISTDEYEARANYLAKSYENGTYMEDRTGGVRDVGYEYSDPRDEGKNPSELDTPLPTAVAGAHTDIPSDNSTGLGTNASSEKVVDVNQYVSSYADNPSGSGRLLNFVHTDGSDDDDKLGYIKLLDTGNLMSKVAAGENKQNMEAIYSGLKSRYNRFIITSIQESRSERSAIMPTVGDSFAATFSGREPMVLAVQGLLICDHDKTRLTWYHAFMNAYEHYLRASRLAKFRVRMKLVLPDFTDYTGYMLTIGTSITSDNDMVIPMNFSMLVCNEAFNKAYGINGSTEGENQTVTITPTAQTITAPNTDTSAAASKDSANVVSSQDNNTAAGALISKNDATVAAGTPAKDPGDIGASRSPSTTTTTSIAQRVNQEAGSTGVSSAAQALKDRLTTKVLGQRDSAIARNGKVIISNPDGTQTIRVLGERVKGGVQL